MSLWSSIGLAARALLAHRFRAALTLLSVFIGALAIVLMSSLAQSGFATIKRSIEEVGGARLILIVPKEPERARAKAKAYRTGLTDDDRERSLAGVPHVLDATRFASLRTHDVTADDGASAQADLVAGDQRFVEALHFRIGQGRGFDQREHREHARVCVVGHPVAAALGRGPSALLGRQVSIDGLRCRVVGVFAPQPRFGFGLGFDWEKIVVIPAETAEDRYADLRHRSLVMLRTDAALSNELVMRVVNARLSETHHGVDDFSLLDFSGMLRKFEQAVVIMEAIAGCLAGVALLIGGIGIMNMMLVSVNERVREIGIQKALGARPAHLLTQFLSEAVLLSLSGGGVGVLAGIGAAIGVSVLLERVVATWVGVVSWPAVVAAMLSSVGTGALFGWLPARRAAGLQPVEAMRR
jgi:putative ABC transport system permease protein